MSHVQKKEVVRIAKGEGLIIAQMLMVATKDLAHHDSEKRDAVFDYMRICAEFQKDLGARQLLICWGGGLYESGTTPEQSWCYMVENISRFAEYCLKKTCLLV